MFDPDNWLEIFETLRRNKLRSLLTGFSVAWGIFMLLVLLGSGQGLADGVEYQFRDDAINSIWVFSGQTSIPYKGLAPGRQVQFTNRDHEEVKTSVAGVEHITSRFRLSGPANVRYKDEATTFDVRSVHPDHLYLENTIVTAGRFLNDLDIAEHRKCCAIGKLVERTLFKGEPGLGKTLSINGIAFSVVGVFEDAGGEGEMQKIYLPITTAQRTFNGADRIHMFMLTTGTASVAESERMADEIRTGLATRHHFSPDDKRALFVNNNVEKYARFASLIQGIRLFVWIVGLGTILAGVVSVSNIMMIVVSERTKEIGIRKALGATPGSIVSLVMQEAICITTLAGYAGLVAGLAVLELAAAKLPESSYFRQPHVDVSVAVYATLVLVAAGVLGGFLPARRAAAIRPIEALRDE